MAPPLQSGLLRFWRSSAGGRAVAGTGFLVLGADGKAYALTCAHVANLVFNRSKETVEPLPSGSTTAELIGRGEVALDLAGWFPPPRFGIALPSPIADIAVFTLRDPPVLPFIPPLLLEPPTRVVPSGASIEFHGFGFMGPENGVPTRGALTAVDAGGWFVANGDEDFRRFIEEGLSGAPVFANGRVLGMVAQRFEREVKQGLVIPAYALAQAWPFLAQPYPGLPAFNETTAHLYFGRGRPNRPGDPPTGCLKQLIDKLEAQRLVALMGASGSGKSSLANAGVAPFYAERGWATVTFRPGLQPLFNLAQAIAESVEGAAPGPARLEAADHWIKRIEASNLEAALNAAQGAGAPGTLIIIDQFEEFFTAAGSREAEIARQRNVILPQLLAAADRPDVRCLLTGRLDLIESMVRGDQTAARMLSDPYPIVVLTAMSAGEVREAVEGPASVFGVQVDPSFAADIAAETTRGEGRLPLLQSALRQAWVRIQRTADGWRLPRPQSEAQDTAAILDTALGERADAAMAALRRGTAERQGIADEDLRRVLLSLVRIAEGVATRRLVTRVEMGDDWSILEALAEERLVVLDGEQGTAELVHEALMTRWPLLKGCIDSEMLFLIWRERFDREFASWDERGRKDEDLLRRQDVATALAWCRDARTDRRKPNDAQRAFIVASDHFHQQENLRQKRLLRRTRQWLAVATAAGLAAAVALFFAQAARRDANRQAEAATAAKVAADNAKVIADTNRTEAEKQRNAAVAAEHDAQRELASLFQERGRQALIAGANEDAAVFLAAAYGYDPGDRLLRLLLGEAQDKLAIRGASFHAHEGLISQIAYSPDGKLRVTAGESGVVKLWDSSGHLVHAFNDQYDLITAVAFDPSGRFLATGSRDGTVSLRDLSGITLSHAAAGIGLQKHVERVTAISFDRAGRRLLTASSDGVVALWDATNGRYLIEMKGSQVGVTGAVFAGHDDSWIVSSADDGTVKVWDAASGVLRDTIRMVGRPITRLAVDHNGAYVAAGANDGTVFVYDMMTTKTVINARFHSGNVNSLGFDTTGSHLVSASDDGTAAIWDVRAGTASPVAVLGTTGTAGTAAGNSPGVLSAAFGSGVVATTDQAGMVRLWNLDGTAIAGFRQRSVPIFCLAFAPNGEDFVTAGSDGDVVSWHASTPLIAAPTSQAGDIESIAFSPDGAHVVTGSRDGTAAVSAIGSNMLQPLAILPHAPGKAWVTSAQFDPTGEYVVTAGGDEAKVWDIAGVGPEHPLNPTAPQWSVNATASDKRIQQAEFLPTGGGMLTIQRASFGSSDNDTHNDNWTIWSNQGRTHDTDSNWLKNVRQAQLSTNGIYMLALSDAGIATYYQLAGHRIDATWYHASAATVAHSHFIYAIGLSDGTVQIVTAGGEVTQRIHAQDSAVTVLALSQDDRILASAGGPNGIVKLWSLDSGDQLATLRGHSGAIDSISFSPDGAFVLTTSEDGTAKLWLRETGVLVASVSAGAAAIQHAAFAPNGDSVVIGASDGRLYLWPLPNGRADAALIARQVLDEVEASGSSPQTPDPILAQAMTSLIKQGYGEAGIKQREAARQISTGLADSAEARPAKAADKLLPMLLAGSDSVQARLAAADLATRYAAVRLTLRTDTVGLQELAFADHGRKLVTGSYDMMARVWDVQTGKLLYTLGGFNAPVDVLNAQPDGNLAVVASADSHTARVWDLATGKEEPFRLKAVGLISIAYFSDDGRDIVTRDSTRVQVWDAAGGHMLCDSKSTEPIIASGIARNGSILVLATAARLRVVPVGINRPPIDIDASANDGAAIHNVQFDDTGERLVTSQGDKVRIWDSRTGQMIQQLTALKKANAAFFIPGHNAVLVIADGTGLIWDVANPTVAPAPLPGFMQSTSVSFSRDGRIVMGVSSARDYAIWDLNSRQLMADLDGEDSDWRRFGLAANGAVAATTSSDGFIHLWNVASGRPLAMQFAGDASVISAQTDTNNARLLTRDSKGGVTAFALHTGKLLWHQAADPKVGQILDARLTPDGASVMAAIKLPSARATSPTGAGHSQADQPSAPPGYAVLLLDAATGAEKHREQVPAPPTLAPSDATFAMPTADGHVVQIDLSNRTRNSFNAPGVNHLTFDASGSWLIASTQSDTVTVFSRSGKSLVSIPKPDSGTVEALGSRDGNLLLTFGHRLNVSLWNARTGTLISLLNGHQGDVTSARFSPDNSRILTTGADGTVRLWSATDGSLQRSYGGTNDWLTLGIFAADGQFVITRSEDGLVKIRDGKGVAVLQLSGKAAAPDQPLLVAGDSVLMARGDALLAYHLADAPTRIQARDLAARLAVPLDRSSDALGAAQ